MSDLHRRIEEEIERRKAVAEAAAKAPGDWERAAWSAADVMDGEYEVGELIILHDPADALRRYERDLLILEDHRPLYQIPDRWVCKSRCRPVPCVELIRLAASLGIPVGGEDE